MHQQQHNDRQYDYATKTRAHLYPTTRQDNVKAQINILMMRLLFWLTKILIIFSPVYLP